MKLLLLFASFLLIPFLGFGANLNVDATKKKNVRIINPATVQEKKTVNFQNKRYRTKKKAVSPLLHSDAKRSHSSENAGSNLNRSSKQMARIGKKPASKERILEQVVTSSEEFEKAYREALTVELSKRAAAQVEVRKTKATLKQSDINRDARVRRSEQDGFKVQQAGSDEG